MKNQIRKAPVRPASAEPHRTVLAERRRELKERLVPLLAASPRFVWEVGCGHGHFLAAYGAAHPAELCIGIDIANDRIVRAGRKRERARLPNVHFLRADSQDFLEALPEQASLSRVFVLFPDPWPKRRHHKNRLIQPEFLSTVAARLSDGGRLYFRTDHEPYFLDARAAISGHAKWTEAIEAWPFEQATVFQQKAPHFYSFVAALKG